MCSFSVAEEKLRCIFSPSVEICLHYERVNEQFQIICTLFIIQLICFNILRRESVCECLLSRQKITGKEKEKKIKIKIIQTNKREMRRSKNKTLNERKKSWVNKEGRKEGNQSMRKRNNRNNKRSGILCLEIWKFEKEIRVINCVI